MQEEEFSLGTPKIKPSPLDWKVDGYLCAVNDHL